MKHLFLLSVVAICFWSCTKTKTNTVTVTKNDTVIVSYKPTILGKWTSSTGVSPIVFDSTTYTIQSYPSMSYIASPDTVYDVSQTSIISFQWAYKISPHNDTLTLITRATGATDLYLRN